MIELQKSLQSKGLTLILKLGNALEELNTLIDETTEILNSANINLGLTYPYPMVDHATARKRALAAFQETKKVESSLSSDATSK